MASPLTSLEDRFHLAVQTIQNLPADGFLKPSNLTKLIFYGLYKQATVGPCQESKPSAFYVVARAKWDAWDRYRSWTKEQAMQGYIDEIQKIIEGMPQTTEVKEFARSMGLLNDNVDSQTKENDFVTINDNVDEQAIIVSSSPSSSSSSTSSSDIDEVYDDPSDLLALETTSSPQQQTSNSHPSSSIQVSTNQSNRNENHHHHSHSTINRQFNQTNGAYFSASSIAPSTTDEHSTTNGYNKGTQRAILSALTKLQRDINNILERLNRLETSAYLLQQKEIAMTIEMNSSSRWFPLFGFPRRTVTFILLWPFIAYLLIRLYLRAKIIIRFRR